MAASRLRVTLAGSRVGQALATAAQSLADFPQRKADWVRWLLAGATRLFSWLPFSAAWRLADALGALTAAVGADAARITRINLAKCFPNLQTAELKALSRASLGHAWRLVVEAGPLSHWPADRLRRLLVKETGREWIEGPLGRKQAVLLLVPHYGNWEFLCYVLGDLQAVSLYDPPRLPALEASLLASRQRFGMRLLPANAGGLRAVAKKLKAGGLVCILPDQAPAAKAGVFAPFFGQPVLTMTLPYRLLQGTDATVLMASAQRVPGGFAVHYAPLAAAGRPNSAQGFAQALNRGIEALVQKDPAQYLWEYKRFKRQPPGHPNPYPKRRKRF